MNMQGRVFMSACDDPFRKADELLAQIGRSSRAKVILLDIHGEASSEKVALGWYLDGRVTAVLGTHTHIPTADERVLPEGHGVPDGCGDERAVRLGDRGGEGACAAALSDRDAGQVRGGEGQSEDVRRR